jgi:hypothetical protein
MCLLWFLVVKLKSSLRKFYCRHHDRVSVYGISVTQITTDMFRLSHSYSGPFHSHAGSVTIVSGQVSHMEHELLTLPEHLGLVEIALLNLLFSV